MKNLYFLGGGNMCAALLSRLKNNADFSLFVVEKNAERQAFLRQAFDITVANALPPISSDDILLLAVKPQDMQAALNGVETNGALVLSIAAGLSCQTLSNWLDHTHRIVRIMPNTPAQIGMGFAGLFADSGVLESDKIIAQTILNAVGKTVWVENEDDLHTITAISGSGPAYVFYLMNALFQAAVSNGMSDTTARQSVLQTFIGAASLAEQSGEDFGILQQKVTSKGGTTAAALAVFENEKTDKIMQQAVIACQNRSIEMGKTMA